MYIVCLLFFFHLIFVALRCDFCEVNCEKSGKFILENMSVACVISMEVHGERGGTVMVLSLHTNMYSHTLIYTE